MPVEQWSDTIVVADLGNDPQFTDDLQQIIDQCSNNPRCDVLLNFADISFLNSSNIAKLLQLRKVVSISNERRLVLCGISQHVWGVFLVTGLDRIFQYADDKPSGLAMLQIDEG